MKKGWTETTLRAVCLKTIQWKPKTEPRGDFYYIDVSAVSNDTFTITSPQAVTGTTAPGRARKIVHARDVIYATVRPTLRRIALVPSEYHDHIASTAFCVVRADRKFAVPEFLYFLLLSDQANNAIAEAQHGASYPAVTDKNIFKQEVSLPPLPEQKKIAAVLLKIQRAIEIQEQIIQSLRDLKKSTMQHVFTHGLRGEKTKMTEIGEIPESWEVKPLGDIAMVKGGKRLPRGKQLSVKPTPYPYIRVMDFYDNSVAVEQLLFVPPEIQPAIARYIIGKEDIYISIAGTTGVVGIIPDELDGAQLTENAARIMLGADQVDQRFLMHFLDSSSGQAQIANLTTKTSQPKLALARIKLIKAPIPRTRMEQDEMASSLDCVGDKLSVHESKKSALRDLFKTTLNKLMTGDIRIQDLAIDVSEVEE